VIRHNPSLEFPDAQQVPHPLPPPRSAIPISMLPGDAASKSPFRELVEQLRCCVAEASQRRKASDVDTVSGAARGPSLEWTSVELVRLLQQYPAGVTAAVMETELLSQWRSRVRMRLSGSHTRVHAVRAMGRSC